MSIFFPNNCQIPWCEREALPDKKRCGHCADRYDAKGKPFIIYCDIIKLELRSLTLFIWVMDGTVVHHNGYQPYYHGQPVPMLGRPEQDVITDLGRIGYVVLKGIDN